MSSHIGLDISAWKSSLLLVNTTLFIKGILLQQFPIVVYNFYQYEIVL
jgi:hypothetical protein